MTLVETWYKIYLSDKPLMGTILRIISYLALGNSIFWAFVYAAYCIGIKNGTIHGFSGIGIVAPFLYGTPINLICLLAFIISACYLILRKIRKRAQVLGIEPRLVWGAILLLNLYYSSIWSQALYAKMCN